MGQAIHRHHGKVGVLAADRTTIAELVVDEATSHPEDTINALVERVLDRMALRGMRTNERTENAVVELATTVLSEFDIDWRD